MGSHLLAVTRTPLKVLQASQIWHFLHLIEILPFYFSHKTLKFVSFGYEEVSHMVPKE
jgi:hypothetical protein